MNNAPQKSLGELLWLSLNPTYSTEVVTSAWVNFSFGELPEKVQNSLNKSATTFLESLNGR